GRSSDPVSSFSYHVPMNEASIGGDIFILLMFVWFVGSLGWAARDILKDWLADRREGGGCEKARHYSVLTQKPGRGRGGHRGLGGPVFLPAVGQGRWPGRLHEQADFYCPNDRAAFGAGEMGP